MPNLSLKKKISGLGFFVYWHINILGLSNAKAILLKQQ